MRYHRSSAYRLVVLQSSCTQIFTFGPPPDDGTLKFLELCLVVMLMLMMMLMLLLLLLMMIVVMNDCNDDGNDDDNP